MSKKSEEKKIFQVTYKIDDILTTFLFVFYNDVILILISQLDKIGTLIRTKQSSSLDGDITFQTEVLLGKRDDPSLEVFARQLAELLSSVSPKPLLVGISIKQNAQRNSKFSISGATCKKFLKVVYDNVVHPALSQ